MTASSSSVSPVSLAVPLLLLAILTATLIARLGINSREAREAVADPPQTVVVAPHSFSYRDAGEFYRGGYAVDAPLRELSAAKPLEIMKYQVSEQEYSVCVDDGGCLAPERPNDRKADVPIVGVSYDDALSYAAWLSRQTGETWRLPRDEELAFAAGSRFPDDALGVDADARNPALRWLADYRREVARKASSNPSPRPRGSFAESEFGLADFAGNIWEWTGTCNRRVILDDGGDVASDISSCGIYLAVGKHRSPMSSFVRDPKGGGCSVGTPPDNLGFRLVKDTRWYMRLLHSLRRPAG